MTHGLHQPSIRIREIEGPHNLHRHPGGGLMLLRQQVAAPRLDPIRHEADGDVGIVVDYFAQERADAGIDGEFFRKLTVESLLGGLACLDLSAGEFPFVGLAVAWWALGQEDLVVAG